MYHKRIKTEDHVQESPIVHVLSLRKSPDYIPI